MECMRDSFQKNQLLDGRFRTIAPLNHGSFGMVFLAEDITTQQEVAIKCLTKPEAAPANAHVAIDEGAEELACHAILKHHPHLVNLVHHFQTETHTYLVLEYCSQGDLYEAIRNGRGPLQTEHVRRFMLQLLSAVEHMHINGLYHRDIKPENIFLTQDGAVKLGDFGLATASLWSQEACVGSDRYMAPEQYDHGGNGYSPAKGDLWSIGICLLNVLFSRNPFTSPTESDILFADYVRDRQSLFDIFPSMSQDTFEVLSIAMAIDPTKRDLAALREAISQVMSFTTEEDDLDDEFCTEERDVVRASANREPLRTPSLQSPNLDGETFPWAKALHTSPPQRQLSAIPDDSDYYDEDLFPASEKGLNLGESWFSAKFNTPSVASVLDSAFGGSYKSVAIRVTARNPPRPGPITIPNSLPAPAPRPIPTMSSVFGKKDSVAKSWSDMWDEDEEESEREDAAPALPEPQHTTHSWSHEATKKPSATSKVLREKKSCSALNARPKQKTYTPRKSSGSSNENDPTGWKVKSPKRSPKQVPADKWAALGDRRRNFQTEPEPMTPIHNKRRSLTMSSKKKLASSTPSENYGWPRKENRSKNRPAHLDQDWRLHKTVDSSPDDDHHEWVGGWHNFHL